MREQSVVHAFTILGDKPLLELSSSVGITRPHEERPEKLSFYGVWDTGATGCAITKEVANKIGVYPCGLANIAGIHGTQLVETYLVALHLPTKITIPIVEATELDRSAGCDFLIGMDIIGMGDHAISNFERKTSFTFRIPSIERFDFTQKK